jgi:hypothetical protein
MSVSLARRLAGKRIDNVKWGIKSTKHGKVWCNICLFMNVSNLGLHCVRGLRYVPPQQEWNEPGCI